MLTFATSPHKRGKIVVWYSFRVSDVKDKFNVRYSVLQWRCRQRRCVGYSTGSGGIAHWTMTSHTFLKVKYHWRKKEVTTSEFDSPSFKTDPGAQGRRQWVRAPEKKISSNGRPTKNIYTKLERPTLSCRVTWTWCERVNLYKRQAMILPRKTETYGTYHHLLTNKRHTFYTNSRISFCPDTLR